MSTNTERTEGEWNFGIDGHAEGKARVFTVIREPGRAEFFTLASHIDNWEDARLMAAAPELLAAVQILVAADNCNYETQTMRDSGLFDLARVALDKATGGNQFIGYDAAIAALNRFRGR